jgi:citrate lyase beta subunit
MSAEPQICRTLLFVPGTRPERFEKALGSGADRACIDLEDAVPPDDKPAARDNVVAFLAAGPSDPSRLYIRINPLESDEAARDIAALMDAPAAPGGIVVPKAASADALRQLDADLSKRFPDVRFVPIIESARGVAEAAAIAAASPLNAFLAFGSADFCADIGAEITWDTLLYARSAIVVAATVNGLGAIDGVHFDFSDDAGLGEEARRIAALGFQGKLAIHPRQVPIIHDAFRPSADAVADAERVLAAYEAAGEGVARLDDRMIDQPVATAAKRVLALAKLD